MLAIVQKMTLNSGNQVQVPFAGFLAVHQADAKKKGVTRRTTKRSRRKNRANIGVTATLNPT